MARKPRLFAPGVLYHVIVRGNQRQKTFVNPADYQNYLEKLAAYRRRYDVTVYAYCLMPNHVHLLLECGRIPLGKFMQGLQQSYTQYFNRKHRKVGHLFQGRYKAILCQKDAYLMELVRYIHLNPVRSRLVGSSEAYPYSGDGAYRRGKPTEVVDPGLVLKMLGGSRGYGQFVREGLKEGHREEYYELRGQRFLGEEEFGERLKRDYGGEPTPERKPGIEVVAERLALGLKVHGEELRAPNRGRAASHKRTLVAYVLVRRAGYKVEEVARYFGRDATTISSLLSRYEKRMQAEPRMGQDIEKLARIV